MPRSHDDYEFSVTLRIGDLAVLSCLRALSHFSQQSGNNRIPAYGATDQAWSQEDHTLSFRFTTLGYRSGFLDQATRLLPSALFEVVGQHDNDPASPW